MIYVMSDIHGCYDKYIAMLDKIQFSDRDTLYILGDVVDRGADGIKILLDIMRRNHVELLMGNHEYFMAALLSDFQLPIDCKTALNNRMLKALKLWFDDGGESTFSTFLSLSANQQKQIVSFLKQLRFYVQIEVSNQQYVFVHSGFQNFSLKRSLESYQKEELLFCRPHLQTVYFPEKIVIVGHTPTFFYHQKYTGKIIKKNQIIHIDCGCAYSKSGVLGCLRLDDLSVYYIR